MTLRPICMVNHFRIKMIRIYFQSQTTSHNGRKMSAHVPIGWLCPNCMKIMFDSGFIKKEESHLQMKKHLVFKK